ncbi:hypothetical protein N7470_010415 [Penicillium chermesinum]|nr:hypothetical protein N7470_010415 [Penicillium chermesinum]
MDAQEWRTTSQRVRITSARISVASSTEADPETETLPPTTTGTTTQQETPARKKKGQVVQQWKQQPKCKQVRFEPPQRWRQAIQSAWTPLHVLSHLSIDGHGKNRRPGGRWAAANDGQGAQEAEAQESKEREADRSHSLFWLVAMMQLCRALIKYGDPHPSSGGYMIMTANVLEVNAQFLYIPGCMFMSFADPLTRTTKVKIIRVIQGLDLSRLAEVHSVYKNVMHDIVSVDQATTDLDEIMQRNPRYNKWLLVLLTGLASVAHGPILIFVQAH